MKHREKKRKIQIIEIFFLLIPLLIVLCWAAFFFFTFPFNANKYKNDEETEFKIKKTQIINKKFGNFNKFSAFKNALNSSSVPRSKLKMLTFKSRRIDEHNQTVEEDKTIDLSKTVFYIDMWRSHWCTYYNSREFFFTPRINELAQIIRSFNVPVIEITMNVDAVQPNSVQRKRGKAAVSKGVSEVLESFHERKARYYKYYIPGFEDVCVYDDQTRYGKYRDNSPTKQIALTDDDYFVSNFKEAAESFVGMGAKHVIFSGQHTNMCLMAVFQYCQQVGLDLILVRDLSDGAWVYEKQKKHCKTHTEGNNAILKYYEKKFGCTVLSYDLIRALSNCQIKRKQKTYTRFTNHAYMFKYL